MQSIREKLLIFLLCSFSLKWSKYALTTARLKSIIDSLKIRLQMYSFDGSSYKRLHILSSFSFVLDLEVRLARNSYFDINVIAPSFYWFLIGRGS